MSRVRCYIDPADWWVGLYIGPNHLYLCPLPTVVIRVTRATSRPVERPISNRGAA